MKTTLTSSRWRVFVLFVCFSVSSIGMSALTTKSIEFKGETATITNEIPEQFYGEYESKGGMCLFRYTLNEDGTGSYWESGDCVWREENRHPMEWGLMVQDDQLLEVEFEVSFYGEREKHTGYLLIVKLLEPEVFVKSSYLFSRDDVLYVHPYCEKK